MYVCLCVSACVCATQWVVSEIRRGNVWVGVHMYVRTYIHTCMGTYAACMGACQPRMHL